ncbi:MAG: hypothetical protein ACPGGJ_01920 [Coraliomargarita sp.]
MNETFLETILVALKSGNWIAWCLLVLALVVAVKLLVKLSKSIVIALILVGVFFGLGQLNPGLTKMVVDSVLELIPDSFGSEPGEGTADPE